MPTLDFQPAARYIRSQPMNPLPIDLLIFDLDGTLADTRQDLADAVNHVRRRLGLPELSVAEVMRHVGRGVRELVQGVLPEQYRDRLDEAVRWFAGFYQEHALDHTRLYPGVEETLEHFHQKKRAVISNKPEALSRLILQGLGIAGAFNVILGGDSLPVMKPDPAPILHVLRTLDVRPERAVILGDGTTDIEAGRAVGIHTCAVTYGFRPRDTLAAAHPEFILDDLRELKSLFC